MKKKIVSLLLVACMLLSILPMGMVSAREGLVSGTCGESVTWELNLDSGELVISGTGPMENYDLETPSWYEYAENIKTVRITEGVTSVGAWAFTSMSEITAVDIAATVETIGALAFLDCTNLTTVSFKEGLKSVKAQSFENIAATVVSLPASVEFIESNAFSNCRNLQKFVVAEGNPYYYTDENGGLFNNMDGYLILVQCPGAFEGVYHIPGEVSLIQAWAFSGCTKLTGVVLPEWLDTIDAYAFDNCSALTQLFIPESVYHIGHSIVANCGALQKILVAEENEYFCNDAEGVLFNKDMTELVQYPTGRGGHYDVPVGVTTIGYQAFYGSESITSVSVPETVETIKSRAFYGTRGLTEIKLSEGLKEIGNSAFAMTSAKYIVIPASVESIGAYALDCGEWETVVVLNPDCVIADRDTTLGYAEQNKIYGLSGSTAETYARNNGYTFVSLSDVDCEKGKHIYGKNSCILCGAPAVDESIVINHSLELSNNIALNYVIHESYLKDKGDFYMEIKVPDADGRYNSWYEVYGVKRGEYYYFVLSDITAVQMTDILEARLVMTEGDREIYSTVDRYSIATYASNQLNKSYAPEGLKKVCAELLRYGASAQLYKEYRTDALADAGLTEEQKGYLTDLSTVDFNNQDMIHEDLEAPVVDWVGVSLDLWSSVTLRYVVDLSRYSGSVEDLTMYVDYETADGEYYLAEITDPVVFVEEKNWYAFDVSFLRMLDMRSVVKVGVYEGDNMISCTRSYSVDTYCSGMEGTLGTLCSALISLSDSAVAYFGN